MIPGLDKAQKKQNCFKIERCVVAVDSIGN